MKKIIDKFTFTENTEDKLEDVRNEILNRIENSNKLVIDNNSSQGLIRVDSKELEWMMFPMLPKYCAKIRLGSSGQNRTYINVVLKGNFLFTLFKYLGLILFLIGLSVWIINLINPFDEFFNYTIMYSMGPLGIFYILNFMNRYNMKTGYQEISKVVKF
jgi:hypothetical protein